MQYNFDIIIQNNIICSTNCSSFCLTWYLYNIISIWIHAFIIHLIMKKNDKQKRYYTVNFLISQLKYAI